MNTPRTVWSRLANIGYKITITGLFAFVLIGGFNLASGTYHIIGLRKRLEVCERFKEVTIGTMR